jgi:hypothetical protein
VIVAKPTGDRLRAVIGSSPGCVIRKWRTMMPDLNDLQFFAAVVVHRGFLCCRSAHSACPNHASAGASPCWKSARHSAFRSNHSRTRSDRRRPKRLRTCRRPELSKRLRFECRSSLAGLCGRAASSDSGARLPVPDRAYLPPTPTVNSMHHNQSPSRSGSRRGRCRDPRLETPRHHYRPPSKAVGGTDGILHLVFASRRGMSPRPIDQANRSPDGTPRP